MNSETTARGMNSKNAPTRHPGSATFRMAVAKATHSNRPSKIVAYGACFPTLPGQRPKSGKSASQVRKAGAPGQVSRHAGLGRLEIKLRKKEKRPADNSMGDTSAQEYSPLFSFTTPQ